MTEAAAQSSSPAVGWPRRALGDERLAQRAAEGDRRAFAAIFKRHQADLYRFCLAIVGNGPDAQDALQNTMVKALGALPGETRQIELKPWLYRLARNEAINVIRGRREAPELDPERVVSTEDVSGSVEARDRLRRLLADLGRLPERQHSALVMRELGGFEFAEIGEALGTSAATARQTVYEARLGLREMEGGREMACEQVMEAISANDGRTLRRRDIRAHLRNCEDCRRFRDAIAERSNDLAAIAPLPALASAGLLHAILGGAGSSGGGALTGAGATGTVAGKALVTSTAAKSLAAVALVAAGIGAANRTGLIETPVPGGTTSDHAVSSQPTESGLEAAGERAASGGSQPTTGKQAIPAEKGGRGTAGGHPRSDEQGKSGDDQGTAGEATPGASGELPPASSHGQATAASHGGGRGASHSHGGGKEGSHSSGKGHSSEHAADPTQEGHPPHPSHPPDQAPPPEVRPDNEPAVPLKPPKSQSNQGGAAAGERPER